MWYMGASPADGKSSSNKVAPRTKVFFRWDCSDASPSEEVRVVGGCDELGNWNPEKGVALTPARNAPSCWTSPAVSLPMRREVRYKYVVCTKLGKGGEPRWEGIEGDRAAVPTGRHHVLEDDLGRFRNVVDALPHGQLQTVASGVSLGTYEADPMGGVADMQQRARSTSILPVKEHPPKLSKASKAASESMLPDPSELEGDDADQRAKAMPKLQSFDARRKREEELEVLKKDDKVICIFRTLPFRVSKENGKWVVHGDSESITFKVVSLVQKQTKDQKDFNIKFVGDPGVCVSDPEDKKQITEALAKYSCVPVFLDSQVLEQSLEFCHSFLWPVMHNMKVFDDETMIAEEGQDNKEARQKFDEATWERSWRNYQLFNKAYASAAQAHVDPESLVWVHDFYLLLVPRYLQVLHKASVGFFLHSAFPSSEVLLCMPCREEILQSLLTCKVVTFQVFEYARHFLSCCQYLLNTTHSFQGAGVLYIEYMGENIMVRSDHFVLPYKALQERCTTEEVQAKAAAIRMPFGNRLVFGAVDGDQPFSGMILKMRAFHKFLSECPQHRSRVALLQHVLPRRTADAADSELLRDMKRLAEETNKQFSIPGEQIMIVTVGDLDVDERLGVMMASDILLDTSINDGLNLHPFLFCCAHEQARMSGGFERQTSAMSTDSMDVVHKGTMIVSEFSGCSSVLTGALKVNPWHTQAVMDAMHTVVTMEADELDRRFKQDHSYISSQDLKTWVQSNLAELKKARAMDGGNTMKAGLGAGGMLFNIQSGFRHVPHDLVSVSYKKARTRAIFLDFEGTLAPDMRSLLRTSATNKGLMDGKAPSPQVLDVLTQLTQDKKNTVVVISGRNKKSLEGWFGGVEGLGLCAEHGFDFMLPSKLNPSNKRSGWRSMQLGAKDDDWKTIVTELMLQYVKRVQGSIVENKGSAITWNYRRVGAQQLAKEIALELARFLDPRESLMHGYPVRVVSGKGYVEVRRTDVDKGATVSRLLKEMSMSLGNIDFVLCIGDDRSDEDMFEIVNKFAEDEHRCLEGADGMLSQTMPMCASPPHSPKSIKSQTNWSDVGGSAPVGGLRRHGNHSRTLEEFNPSEHTDKERGACYTITVGRKPSKASYFLKDVNDVFELLQKLALQTRAANMGRYQSMPNFSAAQEALSSDEDV